MKTEYVQTQDKVVMNILKCLETKFPDVEENKVEFYIEYLSKVTDLKSKRIRTILNTTLKKRITFYEIYQIAVALKVSMNELFTFNDIK